MTASTTSAAGREAALRAFEANRAAFLGAFAATPDGALAYRAPNEDYALSGLVEHVADILRHYAAVLDAIVAANFGETRVSDSSAEQNLASIRAGITPAERGVALDRLTEAHAGLVQRVEQLSAEDFVRTAPVFYGAASDPFATSAGDVVKWVDDHYDEHTRHIRALLQQLDAGQSAAPSSQTQAETTRSVVERFNDTFNRHDLDAIMALMTDDCIFEDTEPRPDGTRYVGSQAVRSRWEALFRASPSAVFTTEELFVSGDRAVVRWRYDWGAGHVRGTDVLRVRDGKVAEKLAYVKG